MQLNYGKLQETSKKCWCKIHNKAVAKSMNPVQNADISTKHKIIFLFKKILIAASSNSAKFFGVEVNYWFERTVYFM